MPYMLIKLLIIAVVIAAGVTLLSQSSIDLPEALDIRIDQVNSAKAATTEKVTDSINTTSSIATKTRDLGESVYDMFTDLGQTISSAGNDAVDQILDRK